MSLKNVENLRGLEQNLESLTSDLEETSNDSAKKTVKENQKMMAKMSNDLSSKLKSLVADCDWSSDFAEKYFKHDEEIQAIMRSVQSRSASKPAVFCEDSEIKSHINRLNALLEESKNVEAKLKNMEKFIKSEKKQLDAKLPNVIVSENVLQLKQSFMK